MRKALLIVAGCAAILSTAALSQSARGPGDDGSRPDGYRGEGPRDSSRDSWRDGGRERWRDQWRESGKDASRDGERGEREGGWRGGNRMWREQGEKRGGASFVLRNGSASIAMRCGDDPLQACVDAALKLMAQARSAQPATPPNAPVPQ